jgi:signal transduction histidine kinase
LSIDGFRIQTEQAFEHDVEAVQARDRLPGLICKQMEPVEISADREKMRMVLRNLLDNALKHTPDKGDPIEIAMVRIRENVSITIEDNF